MTHSLTLATLEAARARIADPAHWTQHHCAVDSNDSIVNIAAPEAARWCWWRTER